MADVGDDAVSMEHELAQVRHYATLLQDEMTHLENWHRDFMIAFEAIKNTRQQQLDEMALESQRLQGLLDLAKRARHQAVTREAQPSAMQVDTDTVLEPCQFSHSDGSHRSQLKGNEDLYNLLDAAHQGCLQCTRYYVEQKKVSYKAGSPNSGWTAYGWAVHINKRGGNKSTTEVVEYLKKLYMQEGLQPESCTKKGV